MDLAPEERQERGLVVLCAALRDIVDRRMSAYYDGKPWKPLYEAKARDRGSPVIVDLDDPRFVLRMLAKERAVFREFNATQHAWLDELLQAANDAAFAAELEQRAVHRTLETMQLLAESFGLDTVADSLQELLIRGSEPASASTAAPAEEEPMPAATHEAADTDEPVQMQDEDTGVRDEGRPTIEPPDGAVVLQAWPGSLDVVAIVHESVNFALVHNGVSPIIGLTVRNDGETTAGPVSVTFEFALPAQVSSSPLSAPLTVDLGRIEPGETRDVRTPDLAWRLSPGPFLELDESATAAISLQVDVDGGTAARAETTVRILPADQWWAGNSPDSLVAFVRPNEAAVAQVRDAASALLQRSTGNPSLQGYQADSDRVHRIAEAVYDVMAEREIVYTEPPASFERSGQRIRSHSEVLEQRAGTCLDLACTYAAALEHAGLAPVVVVTKNHAFCGYLTEDTQLPEALITDKSAIITIAESASFEAVETTALCAGEDQRAFDEARGAARPWWTTGLDEVRALIDVRSAHRWIRPLPTIRREGDIRVIETVTAAPVVPDRRGPSAPDQPRRVDVESAPARVARWKRSLLDLSFINPLLKIKERSSSALHVPAGALGMLEDLIAADVAIELSPHDAVAELHHLHGARTAADVAPETLRAELAEGRRLFVAHTATEYPKKLKALQRRARTAREETGNDTLYVAIGTLHWTEGAKTGHAPIFLVPVGLRGGRGSTPFEMKRDDTRRVIEPNYCLYEKIRQDFGLELAELIDPGEDESGIDVVGALEGIRSKLVRAKALQCHVEETAYLATFQFSTVGMWRDLEANWEQLVSRPAVQHLVEKAGQPFDDGIATPEVGDLAEAESALPIPADGSQIRAIRWAGAGKTFILEGPPGTGKSQTITNLIANCLAEGKKVLFVAEKQAALDVVQRRLDEVGLSTFCLDVHGARQTAKAVRGQLREALEHSPDYDTGYGSLRAAFRNVVKSLSRYPQQVHELGPAGLSAWQARQIMLEIADSVPADVPTVEVPRALVMTERSVKAGYDLARDLDEALFALGVPAHSPWRLAGPGASDGGVDRHAVANALRALDAAESAVANPQVHRLAASAETTAAVEPLARWLDAVRDGVGRVPAEAKNLVTDAWRNEFNRILASVQQCRNHFGAVMSAFAPAVLHGDLDSLLARSVAIDGKIFGKKKGRRALLAELAPVTVGDVDLKTLTQTLRGLVETRNAAAQIAASVRALPGVMAPESFNPFRGEDVAALEHQLRGWEISAAYAATVDVSEVEPAARDVVRARGTAGNAVRGLAQARENMCAALGATNADLDAWRGGGTWADARDRVAEQWRADAEGGAFLALQRWVTVRTLLESANRAGMTGFVQQVLGGGIRGGDVEAAVRLAVAREILAERLDSTNLAAFDPVRHDGLIDRYVESAGHLRDRLLHQLPATIVAKRPFDPDARRGEIADLQSQLRRQRGGMTIRQLMQRFGPTIMEVTPCFLMSPASVARFLPAGSVDFDVVVFDEASQIRVPEAVGAMGRGKAVVIVGDSQQMPPSSMFSAGGAGGDDDEGTGAEDLPVPADMDSILTEAVESNLPSLTLTWHYRSRHESLIAFSNQQYYEDRLASFPTPPRDDAPPAVELRRIDGTWEGGSRGAARVNRAEADAVVAEISVRLHLDRSASIGVVTFNTQQRDLILDLLEQRAETNELLDGALRRETEPLFVKNLENVQGDERDVVLFTLAFAKDGNGRVPLNWGPLSRAGGEKRLNVAVTRAKEKVIVFASFDPHNLDLTNSRSIGLAHLKDYLLMAKDGAQHALGRRAPAPDRHLEEIRRHLEEAGLEVRSSLGLSSFTIDLAARAASDAPWLAVLLDGPQWAGRDCVVDRDGLPRAILTGQMGWPEVKQVWLPDWLRDPDSVVRDVVATARRIAVAPQRDQASAEPPTTSREPVAIKSAPSPVRPEPSVAQQRRTGSARRLGLRPALRAETAEPAAESEPVQPEPVPSSAPVAQDRSRKQRFVAAPEDARYDRDMLDSTSRRAHEAIRRELADVVNAEGPVLDSRLARVVGYRFGLRRVRGVRADEILGHLPRSALRRSANGDRVAWPDSVDPLLYRDFRLPGNKREITDIPYEELRNGMVNVAESAFRIGTNDLLKETTTVFGWAQLGTAIRVRLEGVLTAALREGALSQEGDMIRGPDGGD